MFRLRLGIANKNGFLFGTPLGLALPLPAGEGRLRLGIANKNGFLFGTPLNLHYLCRDKPNRY